MTPVVDVAGPGPMYLPMGAVFRPFPDARGACVRTAYAAKIHFVATTHGTLLASVFAPTLVEDAEGRPLPTAARQARGRAVMDDHVNRASATRTPSVATTVGMMPVWRYVNRIARGAQIPQRKAEAKGAQMDVPLSPLQVATDALVKTVSAPSTPFAARPNGTTPVPRNARTTAMGAMGAEPKRAEQDPEQVVKPWKVLDAVGVDVNPVSVDKMRIVATPNGTSSA